MQRWRSVIIYLLRTDGRVVVPTIANYSLTAVQRRRHVAQQHCLTHQPSGHRFDRLDDWDDDQLERLLVQHHDLDVVAGDPSLMDGLEIFHVLAVVYFVVQHCDVADVAFVEVYSLDLGVFRLSGVPDAFWDLNLVYGLRNI